VSAVIQDASAPIGRDPRLCGLGIVNTLVADPVKFLLKEDVTPDWRRSVPPFPGARAGVVPAWRPSR
jgi:hypothetical protein